MKALRGVLVAMLLSLVLCVAVVSALLFIALLLAIVSRYLGDLWGMLTVVGIMAFTAFTMLFYYARR